MNTLPGYDAMLTRPCDDSNHEWSAAADCAFDTLEVLKKAKEECIWITGNTKEKTSFAVTTRWRLFSYLMGEIRKPLEKYSAALLGCCETELESACDDLDRANVDYEGDERPLEHFGYYLAEYAEVIIRALKKEMSTDEAGDNTEAELFENNR